MTEVLPEIPTDRDLLVRVEGVSKKFCRSLKKSLWYGVHDIASELNPFSNRKLQTADLKPEENASAEKAFQGSGLKSQIFPSLRESEFWAVRDVSFEVRRGECLGLIGRNGAGKTTLLKMLNGLIKPDSGRIEMRGRIGALIALGAGFNPILTGRENIYVNASVLGLSKREIDAKIDDIIEFAEIPDFIDSPVQTYSSGMQVRLGFAVASALEPDVLILDEVLAVGDAAFRNKCYERIGKLLKNAAVILVTHNMSHVSRICSQTLVMQKGRPVFLGQSVEGIDIYERENAPDPDGTPEPDLIVMPLKACRASFQATTVQAGATLEFEATLDLETPQPGAFFIINFLDQSKNLAAQWFSNHNGHELSLRKGSNHFRCELGPLNLRKGLYHISIVLKDSTGVKQLYWSHSRHTLKIYSDVFAEACYQIPSRTPISNLPNEG